MSEHPQLAPLLAEAILLRQGVRHVLTHRILLADFYLLHTEQRPALPDEYIWIDQEQMDHYAIPRLIEILLESLPQNHGRTKK